MDLARYNEPNVERALFKVASCENVDPDLADTCGESLGEIWCRKKKINFDMFDKLNLVSKEIAQKTMEAICPELLRQENRRKSGTAIKI